MTSFVASRCRIEQSVSKFNSLGNSEMATIADVTQSDVRPHVDGQPTSTVRYDAGMLLFAVWFFVGLFLDGAAHNRGAVDSFFTPWHMVLYTGFASCAAWITWSWARDLRKGHSLLNA